MFHMNFLIQGITNLCYAFDGSSWQAIPSMSTPRAEHTATSFPDGTLLVAGGYDDTGEVQQTFSLFSFAHVTLF